MSYNDRNQYPRVIRDIINEYNMSAIEILILDDGKRNIMVELQETISSVDNVILRRYPLRNDKNGTLFVRDFRAAIHRPGFGLKCFEGEYYVDEE